MNRSVCRVMVGVAAMAVLEMTATPAGAQTGEVKEKPRLYRYDSYWTIPRADWGDVDKDNAAGDQKTLAPANAREAVKRFERAVKEDPQFTLAYIGVAERSGRMPPFLILVTA